MWHTKRLQSKVWLVIPLLYLLLLAVACGASATPTTSGPVATAIATPTPVPKSTAAVVHPGKLTVMAADLGSEGFNHVLAPGNAGNNYSRLVGGWLTSRNEKTEMVPGIASQWGLSADGLTWTFTIRKGVKFHDGTELTPEDVLWSLQHYFSPQAFEYATHGTAQRVSRSMDKIELSGPDKVSLTTKVPLPEFGGIVSEIDDNWFFIMPKRATLHDKEEEAAYNKKPISAGPMSLEQHVQNVMMKFKRFDDFYYQPRNGFPEDKRVNFQSLDLFLVPEEATRVAAVRSGEADIALASLESRNQVEAGGGRLVFGPEGVFVWAILVNCYQPQYPCHDKRVRQALRYTINWELYQRLNGGPEVFQIKGWDAVTPSAIGYTPELDAGPFDPNKGRQLLADAGYPGGRGFGKLIVNTFISFAMPKQVEGAQLVADTWRRELGLDVEVLVGDPVALRERENSGELNGQIVWRDAGTRVNGTSYYTSRYADPKHINRSHEDPELFRLTQEAFQLLDPDEREKASAKLFLRLRDESYHLGGGYVNIPWGVGPRVLTWRPYPMSGWLTAHHTITLK